MAEAEVRPGPGSPIHTLGERLRTSAAVVAAVAGAITGLWTVYDKVRADARHYTAASYETLAPQLNQMAEALRQLEKENQETRQALAAHGSRVRAAAPAAGGRRVATKTPHASAGGAPATEGATASKGEPAADPDDPLGKLVGTVNRARDAVDTIRKVPDSFQKVLEQRAR
jgi:transcriptional regulator with AAA-type ATPase domain